MNLSDCHPEAQKIALALAGGDKRRLVPADDGGVLVMNQPVVTPPPLKPSRKRKSAR